MLLFISLYKFKQQNQLYFYSGVFLKRTLTFHGWGCCSLNTELFIYFSTTSQSIMPMCPSVVLKVCSP